MQSSLKVLQMALKMLGSEIRQPHKAVVQVMLLLISWILFLQIGTKPNFTEKPTWCSTLLRRNLIWTTQNHFVLAASFLTLEKMLTLSWALAILIWVSSVLDSHFSLSCCRCCASIYSASVLSTSFQLLLLSTMRLKILKVKVTLLKAWWQCGHLVLLLRELAKMVSKILISKRDNNTSIL